MSTMADQAGTGNEPEPERKQTAELLRSNERLREEIRRLSEQTTELGRLLAEAQMGRQADRQTRRAALNMMEDAVLARRAEQRENAERRQAEVALRESEERYRRLFESIDEGFCLLEVVVDAAGQPIGYRILEANTAFDQQTGLQQTKDKTAWQQEPRGVEEWWTVSCRKIAAAEKNVRFETQTKGVDCWVEIHASRVNSETGQLFAVVLNDITDRKLAEQQLQELNAALDQRVQERTRHLRASEKALKSVAATARERADRLRELAIQLTSAEQKERRQLARLLHDHVQQLLVAARLRIDLVKDALADQETVERLSDAIDIIDRSIEATRTLSIELAPPLLHDQGLPAALSWLAPRMQEQYRLDINLQVDEEANPSIEEHRDILFHAGREFLLNAVKHAGTNRIGLKLGRANGQVRLEVADQGTGFNPNVLKNSGSSFGLFHLRQRLESIGGSLKVDTRPGHGTRVTATLPTERSAVERSAEPSDAGPAPSKHNGVSRRGSRKSSRI